MNILGISAYYHDSAACLLRDGVIRALNKSQSALRRDDDGAVDGIYYRQIGLRTHGILFLTPSTSFQ